MTTILNINSSGRGEASVSRTLSKKLTQKLASKTAAKVIERDVNDLPFVTEPVINAVYTPDNKRTAEDREQLKQGQGLIDELKQADIIVLGMPIYNFSVPASFKAWADQVARIGVTFRYTQDGPVGLLENKKTYLTVASGGVPVGSDSDFMTPWVKFFLGFLGITDIEIIAADGIMGEGGEEKIQAAHAKIDSM